MAYVKTKEGYNFSTNQKEFFLDDYDDLANIPSDAYQFGDYVYIVGGTHKGELYIADSTKIWTLQ